MPLTNALHQAAFINDTVEIEKLLAGDESSKQALLDARNERDQTPLHVAVENNRYEAVVTLTKAGSNINAKDSRGKTPLHIAEINKFTQIKSHIFSLPFLEDIKNNDGDTVFHLAVVNWSDETLGKPSVALYMKYLSATVLNAEGYSPFHLAIKLDKCNLVAMMLGVQPQLAQLLTRNGEPPMWVAVKHGHSDKMLQLLQDNNGDVNQKNSKIGASAIWLAVYRKDLNAICSLIRNSSFDNATLEAASFDGTSPLLLAMIKGDEKLVDSIFNSSVKHDDWGTLALKVKYALATDVDFEKVRNNKEMLDRTDDEGNTLLQLAMISDSLDMVKGIVAAGTTNSKGVINLANERQCEDITKYLSRIAGVEICNGNLKNTFSVSRDFPKFSDYFDDLFDPLKEANGSWLVAEPNAKDQISYLDLKKHIIPKVNIEWSDIKKVRGGGIPTISLLSQLKRIQGCDDRNTAMIRDFLSILMHIENYLRERDGLFKHLNIVLLPVGSTVEGTKVGRLNELDVMFFCAELHCFLSVEDERTICISEEKYNNLPFIVRDLFDFNTGKLYQYLPRIIRNIFDLNTRKLDMAKFFALFMQSIKKAIQYVVANGLLPKTVDLFLDVDKCNDCKGNTGCEWCQCRHKEPPCVCYTAVGAGLNFVWKGDDENMNMLFTIDIVPNFYVNMNGHSNLILRQKLIRHVIDNNPFGWVEFLKKYIRDDRVYLGQFDLEQRNIASVGIKMVNKRGYFVIRPGLNMHVQDMLKDDIVRETYCFLKVLKTLTNSKIKSFDLKKAISDQLMVTQVESRQIDAISFTSQIMNSPDLKGKFDGLCQSLTNKYVTVDLVDFPVRSSPIWALQLLSKESMQLVGYIRNRKLEQFRLLLERMGTAAKDMLVNGQSFLHYAATELNSEVIEDLLYAGCDINCQDLEDNTVLHCLLQMIFKMYTPIKEDRSHVIEDFILEIVQLVSSHEDINLSLQNNKGETVFHLLAWTDLISNVNELLLSKASKQMLDLKNGSGRTAVMEACLRKNTNNVFISDIIAKGADADVKDTDGRTALHYASQFNNYTIIDLLLSNGASIDESDNTGITPLMHACMNKDNNEVLNLLLTRGADVNAMNNDGITVLDYAVISGHFDTVRILVQSGGANFNNASALGTSLFSALDHLDVLELLLKNGANANQLQSIASTLVHASDEGLITTTQLVLNYDLKVADETEITKGKSPLHIAAENGYLEVIKLLLNNGASVNLISLKNMGGTPLYMASQNGHVDVVTFLLENGADGNMANLKDGGTPLYIALANGHLHLAKELLLSGVDVNKPNNMNLTPLALAAMYGKADVAALLLKNKADVNFVAYDMFTPLHYACGQGHLQIVKLLVEEGGAVVDDACIESIIERKHVEIAEYLGIELHE